ncbi:cupin domain-containing protein [Mycobacteroides abscessus]|uniref:cupin domain-containing protein n=1 Tax=Mycobacteroides abscessus TaxID=36809 RepID=UPI000C25AA2B|nr:cupin domain-containing protein [Mycobacteroides abscessus]
MLEKVALAEELNELTEFWSQRTVAEANGSLFKVAKGIGSTRWHTHDDQDETFLVIDGTLTIELGHRDVVLVAGDLFVVPRGTEHRPVAENEARFLIIGTTTTSDAAGGKPEWSYNGGHPE